MKIKINNLRNLNFSDPYELKHINLIVGKNSSGKSTFLRLFPLLRQSLEKKTSSPILWYGPYVDFGTYKESVCKHRQADPIKLEIETDIPRNMLPSYGISRRESVVKGNLSLPIKLCYTIKDDLIKKFEYEVQNYKVSLEFIKEEKVQIEVDSRKIEFAKGIDVFKEMNTTQFMPYDLRKKPHLFNDYSYKDYAYHYYVKDSLRIQGNNELHRIISKMTQRRISDQNKKNVFNYIINIDIGNFYKELLLITTKNNIPKTISSKITNLKEDDELFIEIKNAVIILYISEYIDLSNHIIASVFSDVDYIAPVRANAERYYRYQGLSVDTIDSKGENIPHFINNLNGEEKKRLNKWLSEHFGFEIYNKPTIGHNSLFIKDLRTNIESNMTDCGFGFSQVIPILLQLWLAKSKPNSQYRDNYIKRLNSTASKLLVNKIIVIEQPELHLHPALQARLLDTMCLIVNEFKEMGKIIYFILETHSETLVNRIYKNMLGGQIKENDFNISIFDTSENGEAMVSFAEFDDNQNIKNWPIGFFQPEN